MLQKMDDFSPWFGVVLFEDLISRMTHGDGKSFDK